MPGEPTNADLAGAHRLAYQLLTGHPGAPTIDHVTVEITFDTVAVGYRTRIQARLWADRARDKVRDVARWAQLLDTDVLFNPNHHYVRMAAVTDIAGVLVGVWTFINTETLTELLPPALVARAQQEQAVAPTVLLSWVATTPQWTG